jgi:hypothetical protein
MNTKLTLRLDEKLIANAKRYSDQSGKSVSQLVADYFALIGTSPEEATQLTPRVRPLIGTLKEAKVTEADHRRHLECKAR